MARMARVVLPGYPHHVTQRGNRRQEVFFGPGDYGSYRSLLAESCRSAHAECWAYCLMPNHVHLILVPHSDDGLRAVLGESHRRYTRLINFRHGWRGHLWQERFHSFPMDERHLLAAVRYVELNPVRAGLVSTAEDWRWSSTRAHQEGVDDELVCVRPMLDRVADWSAYLLDGDCDAELDRLRRNTRTGRPLGDDQFVDTAERLSGRTLRPKRAGRRKKDGSEASLFEE
jgi:putative transposase